MARTKQRIWKEELPYRFAGGGTRTETLKKGQVRESWDASGKSGGQTTTFNESWRRTVTSAALVRGNYRDPNPWSYSWSTSSGLVGSSKRWAYPIGGPNKTRIFVDGQITSTDYLWLPALDWTSTVTSVRNDALSRLTTKVRGSLDLATSLAETGQAVRMLNLVARFKAGVKYMARSYNREIARKLRGTAVRQNLVKDLANWQRGIARQYPRSYTPVPVNKGLVNRLSSLGANGWCEFTYGWNPLISDIRNVAENVVGFVRNNDIVTASSTRKLNERSSTPYSNDGITVIGGIPVNTTGVIRVRFGVKLKPGYDDSLAKWSSLNPVSVLYELTPYSFVLDWFLDMGSYMRNLETALLYGNYFVNGYTSTLIRVERVANVNYYNPNQGGEAKSLVGNAARADCSFSRTLLSSYPTPYLPSFEVDLGSSQLISAAALLRQLLRRV